MVVRIIRIKINSTELQNWLNNEAFVCLEDEEYYSTAYAHSVFDHYYKTDDVDYTFDDWCEEYEVYTKWDINHQYGYDGWEWEVITREDGETQWLIIAVKEY